MGNVCANVGNGAAAMQKIARIVFIFRLRPKSSRSPLHRMAACRNNFASDQQARDNANNFRGQGIHPLRT